MAKIPIPNSILIDYFHDFDDQLTHMKTGVWGHQKINTFLNAEFESRREKNNHYSLRAFARDLSLSPSRLSEILSGKHGLSQEKAELIAKKLKLSATQKKYWIQLALSESARSPRLRKAAQEKVQKWRHTEDSPKIENEQFQFISEWYHGAILELVRLESFKPEIKWISSKLGISEQTCLQAIERLQKLKLLTIDSENRWQINPELMLAFSEVPALAVRNFHRQIINNSLESLTLDIMNDRDIQSMIIAFPKDSLPALRADIKQFMFDIWKKYEQEPATDLYTVSFQFCPVKNRRRGNS